LKNSLDAFKEKIISDADIFIHRRLKLLSFKVI